MKNNKTLNILFLIIILSITFALISFNINFIKNKSNNNLIDKDLNKNFLSTDIATNTEIINGENSNKNDELKNGLDNINSIYTNTDYGFSISLLSDWKNIEVVATDTDHYAKEIIIKNKDKNITDSNNDNYAYIPVLVYTKEDWNNKDLQDKNFNFAAPIPPSVRGENTKYIFSTAPRYNFSYLNGFEDVEKMLQTLKAF